MEPALIVEKLAAIRDSTVNRVWIAELRANAVLGDREALAGLLSFHAIPLLHTVGGLGRITALVVHPKLRGKGIGRRLVGVAEHFARDIHCERLEVTSGEQRHDAHRFYTGFGFSPRSARFVKALG
jgi:GNAT superfamily N-acetyltransferase